MLTGNHAAAGLHYLFDLLQMVLFHLMAVKCCDLLEGDTNGEMVNEDTSLGNYLVLLQSSCLTH